MKTLKRFMVCMMSMAILFTMFATVSFAYTADNVPKYLFDYVYYANRYSDLKENFGYDKYALYTHWCNYGKKEGRTPSPVYDPIYYRDNNPDLKSAFGSDYTKLYEHFCSYGINEFRPSSEFYHGTVYKANYSDLQQAFGNNSKSYVEHFVSFGMAEGRKASASSNALGYKKYMNVDANVNTQPKLTYQAQIQNTGWLGVVNDSMTAGTTGQNLRLEALKINLTDANGKSCISYRAHVAVDGWQSWKSSGQEAGTVGQSKAIEAMQINLMGTYANTYDIYYRLHISTKGWLSWAKNGENAGTTGGGLQAEAIEIKIIPKNQSFNRGSGAAYMTLTNETNNAINNTSSNFTPRTTQPANNNSYYFSKNNVFWASGYGMPNCTAYAYGRAYELLGRKPDLCTGNAGKWYNYNKSNNKYKYGSTPKLGAIACWTKDGNKGHVAVVEKINGDTVTISESHYNGRMFDTKTIKKNSSDYLTSYTFQGYIYILD